MRRFIHQLANPAEPSPSCGLGPWIFLALWPLGLAGKTLIDRTVVTVNDDVILESDIFEFQRKIQGKSFQELFGGISKDVLSDPKKTLQLLIEEKIVDQQVRKLDLKATDQEVDAQIRAILKRNGISMTQLSERLKQLGAGIGEYREGIRRQIERKNLIDREIRPTLEVSDEQVRHFHLRNTRDAANENEYKLAHILLSPAGTKKIEEKVAALYAELKKSPGSFDRLARENSLDPSTVDTGGILGYFSVSSMAKEFRETIPKTPVGQVTRPIRTVAGIHLVKVLDIRYSDFSTLGKERKEVLRSQLLELEMEKKMQLWLERKRAESYIRFSVEP